MILSMKTVRTIRDTLAYMKYDAQIQEKIEKKYNLLQNAEDNTESEVEKYTSAIMEIKKYYQYIIAHKVKIDVSKEIRELKKNMMVEGEI